MDNWFTVQAVSKRFFGLQALQAVSFSVSPGEMVGIIGPNGSGKTTLLNIISGYYAPDTGTIRLGHTRIDGLPPNRVAGLGIARMFQITRLFRRLSVLENLLVVAYATGRSGEREALERADQILAALHLEGMRDEPAASLSGGQQKLLEFGTCFMANPQLVLLDEPFASIHPTLKEILATFIRERHQAGETFLIVSHDIPAVVDLCPRLVVLSAGTVIADGPTATVLDTDQVIEAYLGEGWHGTAS
ncbi:MAG: ABC transporter ATP-binding protein [Nitrospinota bacterium]|nr:MAG: ABC transporter ATP-binding protein [Nitrospinota bacterium]